MKVQLTNTNSKGQIVIPKYLRDELGIDENVTLAVQLSGQGILVSPVKYVVTAGDTGLDHGDSRPSLAASLLGLAKIAEKLWTEEDRINLGQIRKNSIQRINRQGEVW